MPNDVGANRALVEAAFARWMDGTAYISSLFAPEMTWEIVGRSAASKKYPDAASFIGQVLEPFGRRFPHDTPFRPVRIRSILADGDTVAVVWDGHGTSVAGTVYENTYAWFLTIADGRIVDGVAFYDSIAFDELWNGVDPV
ncbi:nuclear transport factor 2 family protein [Agromyces protaetiae]|uniref:Nuclear transport factor 2 family protein n=1 Tax=Agromyces protaetiae TaxID=2509455 RepID=A0A4P6F7K7_9MICO|nr:nuclear transport factor 2 family protein [Agromyces protaetiae]QAY72050.1 nuclear transport factor 2 family protein [Agromyces protaetiae]